MVPVAEPPPVYFNSLRQPTRRTYEPGDASKYRTYSFKDNSIFMLVYKCDGELFSRNSKCGNEVKDELPERWLLIAGKIKNGLNDAHYIESNGTRHFCSRRCLENYLFKDVIPPADSPAINTMTTDPKEQPEEVKAPATETEQEQVPGEATEETE